MAIVMQTAPEHLIQPIVTNRSFSQTKQKWRHPSAHKFTAASQLWPHCSSQASTPLPALPAEARKSTRSAQLQSSTEIQWACRLPTAKGAAAAGLCGAVLLKRAARSNHTPLECPSPKRCLRYVSMLCNCEIAWALRYRSPRGGAQNPGCPGRHPCRGRHVCGRQLRAAPHAEVQHKICCARMAVRCAKGSDWAFR